ncbi:MAG TPA: HAMP domain-containing sensor histidine kinase [Candidatus Nitrosocosmicus sp.]|nr:HAMP domain-containing sensor histidine kinase [Candidatus Nitrosocosmicus sp.]
MITFWKGGKLSMGNIPLISRKIIKGRESAIPQQYKEEIVREVVSINIRREIILSCALIVMIATILVVGMLGLDNQTESLYISLASYRLHITLLLASMTFLLFVLGSRERNVLSLRIAHILLTGLVLTTCAVIAVHNELEGNRPFSYVTAMFCVGSMVLMPGMERRIIYILSLAVYELGIIYWVRDAGVIFQNTVFVSLLLILALVISRINFSAYVSNFMNRKTIEENNEELDRLYKITEENLLRRTEELNHTKELEKIRTAFFANLSHELRTPLNVIYSAEQMLDRTLKDVRLESKQEEIDQYMRIMRQNCYRLIRLIENLIDITKIDAGYLHFAPKSCNIIKIVEDITLSVADYIETKNIQVTFDTEVEEKVISCDPDKIERIILNLLSNAIKFTPSGGQIFVNICDRGSKIILSVKDTGIGIPKTMRDQIFERFVQVDKTSTRAREGSGIGLSLVKSLVEMHAGRIYVESEMGKGSEFIIEIPAIRLGYESNCSECGFVNKNQNTEKISIEFSDIYD